MPNLVAPTSDNLLLGAGALYIDRKDADGNLTGMLHAGNCETLEITTQDDVIQKFESMTKARALYKQIQRRRTVTLKAVLDEFNAPNLALVLMGDQVQSAAQPATAVVGEAVAAATLPGSYFKTALMGPISAVTVHFGAGAGVLGTDYEITNADVGVIHILPGTILTGAVTVDYTPTAYADGLTQIAAGTESLVRAKVTFVGDPSAGPAVMVEIWDVQITPDGALGLISDDFATLGLQMAVQSDVANHPAAPLYQVTYLP
jgi:hypothetical protein